MDMYLFLLNYRATPHATTGASPALLHLGREIRTKVSQVETQVSDVLSAALQSAKIKDQARKQPTKIYADKQNRSGLTTIKAGDTVLLQQTRQNKLSTRYDPTPYRVLERKGPSLVLQRGGGPVFMRNVSLVHKVHANTLAPREDEEYELDEQEGNYPQEVNLDLQNPQNAQRPIRVRCAPARLNDYDW